MRMSERISKNKHYLCDVVGKCPNTSETITLPLFSKWDSSNIKLVSETDLTHKFPDTDYKGIKAVVYNLHGSDDWVTGFHSSEIHHRYALAALVEHYTIGWGRVIDALREGDYDLGASLLYSSMGFQLQYSPTEKNGKIVGIQQDSQMTKTQERRTIPLDPDYQRQGVLNLIRAIDSNVLPLRYNCRPKLLRDENLIHKYYL